MSGVLSRQIFEALRIPLHYPLRYPFRLLSRNVHTMQAPYTGPPTYDTLARRFNSSPSPLAFFINKRQQEARDRGDFIDIHDVGGVDPKDYDVLITDIDSNKLRSEIAEVIGIPYLAKASEADAYKVVEIGHGMVYGPMFRSVLPCVVSRHGRSHWLFFIIDTGAPLTYPSAEACEVLTICTDDDPTYVYIAGYPHMIHVSPKEAHFAEISILGADFIYAYNCSLRYGAHRKMALFFDGQLKAIKES